MRKMLRHCAAVFCAAAVFTCGATDIALVNPGFEAPASGPKAPGWVPTQHWGPEKNYEWVVDTTSASEGKASYRIKRLSPQAFGMIQQQASVQSFAGKTLEFSAMLKTEEVGPEGWLLVANIESRNAILEQIRSTPPCPRRTETCPRPPPYARLLRIANPRPLRPAEPRTVAADVRRLCLPWPARE